MAVGVGAAPPLRRRRITRGDHELNIPSPKRTVALGETALPKRTVALAQTAPPDPTVALAQTAPHAPTVALDESEIHVWQASLDLGEPAVSELAALLAPDERERARRFRFDLHRSRYVVGRGLLRLLLAPHAGSKPGALRFEYGDHGKPRVAGPGPSFNVSHSGPLALFALRAHGDVGVDVELVDHAPADLDLATRFFSATEVQTLTALPPDRRPAAFLACWTRKEAFIKARGDGLSLALDSFDVTLAPGQPAALTRTAWAPREAEQWELIDLSDPRGRYIAAVASDGKAWSVVQHRLTTVIDNQTGEAG